jgi:hypothetical protein
MVDVYDGPFGTYTNVAGVIAATPAAQVAAVFTALLLMIPDPTANPPVSAAHPDFDMIPPHTAAKLRAEIAAAAAAVAAAPTA